MHFQNNRRNASVLPSPLEADVKGGAAERNNTVLGKYERRINLDNTVLTKLLSLQHTTWLLHWVPPTPMTVIGVQDRPLWKEVISHEPLSTEEMENLHIANELTDDDSEATQKGHNGGSQVGGLIIPVRFRVDK